MADRSDQGSGCAQVAPKGSFRSETAKLFETLTWRFAGMLLLQAVVVVALIELL